MHPIEEAILDSCHLSSTGKTPSVIVAYSGGLDSSVLLYAAVQLKKQNKISELSAAHVNHGLQSHADDWQNHCEQVCEKYQLPLKTTRLNLTEKNQLSEADARKGRFQFLEKLIEKGQTILFAHHLDDQVETLLFRLFRGTGMHGMTGIPDSRKFGKGLALRPLLKFSRHELLDYAKLHKLEWIEDPSNLQSEYRRNFIRNDVLSLIRSKWLSVSQSIAQFSTIAKQQVEILDEVAEKDLLDLNITSESLCLNKLIELSSARQNNLLHFWVRKITNQSPSFGEIGEVFKQLNFSTGVIVDPEKSIKVKVSSGWIRSYNQRLYFCPAEEPEPAKKTHVWTNLEEPLELKNGLSICCDIIKNVSSENLLVIRKPEAKEVVNVRARVGGENAHPCYRQHSTELKKIYQELKVPPWKRKWLPLIYYDNQLVAVPDIFVSKNYSTDKNGIVFGITMRLANN